MNSYNHYAYGAIGDWMYRYVAGIDMDESVPAYQRLRICPGITTTDLTYARASFESSYGQIASDWRVNGDNVHVTSTIPANVSADVVLYGARLDSIAESGIELQASEGIRTVEETEEGVRISVGSGTYHFSFKRSEPN
jgi:alpha-L-rhamnosidase